MLNKICIAKPSTLSLEYNFMNLNTKYFRNRSIRSRDNNVLVSTGSRLFKPEVDT